jgi:hypothetical protein
MSDTTQTEQPNTTTPSTPDTSQGTTEGKDAKFTQADLDTYAGKARTEARTAAQKKFLEELGIESVDNLKTILADVKKRQESELSEAQKLQAQIEAANKKAAEAEQRAKDTEAKYLAEQRRSAFESAVTAGGGNNAKRVYALLQMEKPDDYLSVFAADSAAPDDAKLKALIKQVQTDYPEYFGAPGAGSPSNAHGIAPNVQQKVEEAKQDVEKKFGRL